MSLYPVQAEALKRSSNKRSWGHFLEMGLGKTVVSLTEFDELYKKGEADIMMVFCPSSLIGTWKEEIEKHQFKFDVITKPTSLKNIDIATPSVIIYNYEAIISTPGRFIEQYLNNYRTFVVFDESAQIKSFKSKRWEKIRDWHKKAKYIRLLSGRPLVQSPMDLWTQLTVLEGKINSSPYAFRNRYCVMGGWMNKVIVSAQNMEELSDRIHEVSWRADKKTWTDLPSKMYSTRNYNMTFDQNMAYKTMFKDMIVEISENKNISVDQAVHKYSKLQQITSGFMFDERKECVPIMPFEEVPKVKVLDEILEEVHGKTIIFAHYVPTVVSLAKHLNCGCIKGGMSEEEIASIKNEFNERDSRYIVCQLASAKYGLTLLGNGKKNNNRCNTTIYFENSYSLDARIQSEDRNHRHGQINNVLYIDLVGSSVESKIIRALQKKDELSQVILGIKQL